MTVGRVLADWEKPEAPLEPWQRVDAAMCELGYPDAIGPGRPVANGRAPRGLRRDVPDEAYWRACQIGGDPFPRCFACFKAQKDAGVSDPHMCEGSAPLELDCGVDR